MPDNPTRTALVTGAVGAIGAAIARRLHADGHAVALLDRDPKVAGLAAELSASGPGAASYQVDLSDRAQIAAFVDRFTEELGTCDVLVNNAGINLAKPDGSKYHLEEVTDEGWDLMLGVHLTAPFLLCRAFAPGMKAQGWGRIVNVASRAGRTYVPASNVHYSAAKAGLIAMTRMIAGEAGASGLTANCVAPGRVDSALASTNSPEVIAESMRLIPLGRSGNADEVAAAVAFLASDDASYITGHTIDINGGAFMAS
jgi:NAD(P)-dependent dehydrogenase (short-subunit alcohol dehydrogenase family)